MSDACDPQSRDAPVCRPLCMCAEPQVRASASRPAPPPVHTRAPYPMSPSSSSSLPTPLVHAIPSYDPQLHPHHHSYQQFLLSTAQAKRTWHAAVLTWHTHCLSRKRAARMLARYGACKELRLLTARMYHVAWQLVSSAPAGKSVAGHMARRSIAIGVVMDPCCMWHSTCGSSKRNVSLIQHGC